MHPEAWYAEHDVDLRRGTEVTAIDRDAHQVELADGTRLSYGALVLATGSEPRSLPIPGADTALTLRTHADSDRIRATFGEGKRLVVVGAGWIGLEVAAAAREAGTDVTVLEAAELPLLGVLGPEMGEVFADAAPRARSGPAAGREDRRDHAVRRTAGGRRGDRRATRCVLGVGVRPRTELAEAAGLDVDNGVLVDASLRTSDPDIYAVGDIANHDHPVLGRRIRVEHWATALNQPATAAAAILGERRGLRPAALLLQRPVRPRHGVRRPRDPRGHRPGRRPRRPGRREFVAFWLDDQDRILAAMNVNVWDVPDEVRPLIAARTVVDPDKLADPDTAYADVGPVSGRPGTMEA